MAGTTIAGAANRLGVSSSDLWAALAPGGLYRSQPYVTPAVGVALADLSDWLASIGLVASSDGLGVRWYNAEAAAARYRVLLEQSEPDLIQLQHAFGVEGWGGLANATPLNPPPSVLRGLFSLTGYRPIALEALTRLDWTAFRLAMCHGDLWAPAETAEAREVLRRTFASAPDPQTGRGGGPLRILKGGLGVAWRSPEWRGEWQRLLSSQPPAIRAQGDVW
jgi:hypothetical protein